MIFHLHGELPATFGKGNALGQGPRLQGSSHFQPEIVVQSGRRVLLDDEPVFGFGGEPFRRRARQSA